MRILVTGGAGFIGSHFIRCYLAEHPDAEVVNLDKLTYAGNLENLRDFEDDARYHFMKGDICDYGVVEEAIHGVDVVVNFAAETHVDRSIGDPEGFLKTDVFGVHVLLESARAHDVRLFVQISTDEVYGPTMDDPFAEDAPLTPRNPYSASKAGGEMLARSYFTTYGYPVIVTRAANNIGPNQYPEKVVPLFATNAIEDKPLPLYGSGDQERDYMYVTDHCAALDLIIEKGVPGETYNIGAGNHMKNVEMAKLVLRELGKSVDLITHVRDREGHDFRYAVDSTKLMELGWEPEYDAETAIRRTVRWYAEHPEWWKPLKSGEFREYYEKQYSKRLEEAGDQQGS
ncbi:MAG: dTDP-glucose 4,6-dehydratase [Candidatus Eisenbacteria bacterium]|nr:dTDP-glucose 4,6-dehydratase [Candidatus Eisenbacteria bacterium]